ncbi:MAG: DGQHR domain-containing protein [Candidatus Hydrogenedentes bacterium]|nr:DGQHR domain-containing protein [Candidatus Hydrogenedentota bacterium]
MPALRGCMGDWIYYTCLMNFGDVSNRISFAKEIHSSKGLSDLLQRTLDESERAVDIAEYLNGVKERFFSSMVVAVYGGDPQWYEFGNITPKNDAISIEDYRPQDVWKMGFLSLSGGEHLFALDGQHRLAGIKRAIVKNPALVNEELPVIFVSHKTSVRGVQRTRRLFTTLNKKAKPVRENEIIQLDEDDVMAICTRRLVEEHPSFNRGQIAITTSASLSRDSKSWITIRNLYNILKLVFRKIEPRATTKSLSWNRPSEVELDAYYNTATGFFELLGKYNKPLGRYFAAKNNSEGIVRANRHAKGGHILFRPQGLKIVTEIISELTHEMSLEQAVLAASKLPTELAEAPYKGVLWLDEASKIQTKADAVTRDYLLQKLGKLSAERKRTLNARWKSFSGGRNMPK